jgi:CRP/FNR family transcriptional regulator, cyclic AMP receptor protein
MAAPRNISVFLRKVPLFTDLSAQDLEMLSRIVRVMKLDKGDMIFTRESSADSLYVVVDGLVRIFAKSRTGETKTFAYLEPREFFGEMALLQKMERSADAMAMVPSTLLALRRTDFQNLIKKRPQLSVALIKALCERLRRADHEIESLSFNSVLGRVARVLLDLGKRHGKPGPQGVRIGLELSHKELADMVGTAREMVTRVLNRFQRTECLTMNGKSITLINPAKLRDWIF